MTTRREGVPSSRDWTYERPIGVGLGVVGAAWVAEPAASFVGAGCSRGAAGVASVAARLVGGAGGGRAGWEDFVGASFGFGAVSASAR